MADDIHNPQYLVFIEQYARTRNPQKAAHAAKFRDKGMGKRLLKKPEILKAVLARQAELRTLVDQELSFTMIDVLHELHDMSCDDEHSGAERHKMKRSLLEYFGGIKPSETNNNFNFGDLNQTKNDFSIHIAPAVKKEPDSLPAPSSVVELKPEASHES